MMKANPERGKPSGGSIVLVASGERPSRPLQRLPFLMAMFDSVAGVRSGAGPVHCKRVSLSHVSQTNSSDRQRK